MKHKMFTHKWEEKDWATDMMRLIIFGLHIWIHRWVTEQDKHEEKHEKH